MVNPVVVLSPGESVGKGNILGSIILAFCKVANSTTQSQTPKVSGLALSQAQPLVKDNWSPNNNFFYLTRLLFGFYSNTKQ